MESYKNSLALIAIWLDEKKNKQDELSATERKIENERRKIPTPILDYFDQLRTMERLKND